MYIETIPNRNSPPCILLRESKRQGKRVIKHTLANLTGWPSELVEGLRVLLKGGVAVESLTDSFDVVRSRAHGHVAATLGVLRRLKLESLLDPRPCRERDLAVAMIVSRILAPGSKLALARELDESSASTTLAEELGVEGVDEDALYAALDWLGERQESIENALAKRHLSDGVLVLYDITAAYFEGRCCPLARYGFPHGGPKNKLQIVFGLLCNSEGVPVAVEVFEGNTKDCTTVAAQVAKIRERFGLQSVVFVGDRGMLTAARVREDLRPVEGMDWITALDANQVQGLVKNQDMQPSLFDERDLAEIHSPDYPGERLIACRNPLLAEQRARKREELLQATEKELDKIVEATKREKRPLRGKDKIGIRVGKMLGRFKVGKHFQLTINDDEFAYERDEERIQREACLDGVYVIRTSVESETLAAEKTVASYKRLSAVERAFRCMKNIDLKVRPIHHRLENRVKAHVFLCMLAYYVEWHMRQALAPLIHDDIDKKGAEAERESVVEPAKLSPQAKEKRRARKTPEGAPLQSFQSMLKTLSAITRNHIQPKINDMPAFDKLTVPNPLQQHALDLLNVRL
jgi:transposase